LIDGSTIALFPVPFVETGGDNTWQYVLDVVNQLVEPAPQHPGAIKNAAGEVLNPDAAPSSGTYLFEQQGLFILLSNSFRLRR
jgi:hypothetical protein